MTIKRTKNEIIIRINSSVVLEDLELLVAYLRYSEITSKSTATKSDFNALVAEVKKSRRIAV